ncbi:MAG: hypothetical protein K6E30_04160 [Lachnospiraceae bacterium]|nr:hypothetical protein [Lachnospiraceae bacterium]
MNDSIVYSAQNIFGGVIANMLVSRNAEQDSNINGILGDIRDTVDDYIEQA